MEWRGCDRAWPPPHPSVRGQGPGVRRPLAGHPLQPPLTLANFQRGLHAAHAHKNVQEILAVQDHARDGEENLFPHISGKKSSTRLAKWTSQERQHYTSSRFYLWKKCSSEAAGTLHIPFNISHQVEGPNESWQQEISSAVFWGKVILVPKVILRYGGLEVFFLWTQKKAPRKARRWPHLKS